MTVTEIPQEVYSSLKEKIEKVSFGVNIGGMIEMELELHLAASGINVSDLAKDMMRSPAFSTLQEVERIRIARLSVRDLGFTYVPIPGKLGYEYTQMPSTNQLYKRAQSLGLELCPAETGPHLRLQYTKQGRSIGLGEGDWFNIFMNPITASDGQPGVFSLRRNKDGLYLSRILARPDCHWPIDFEFVFRLRN